MSNISQLNVSLSKQNNVISSITKSMNESIAAAIVSNCNSTAKIEKFLNLVDSIAERLGLNVTQIVEIERLRSFPPNTFGRNLADFLDRNHLAPLTTGPRRKQLHDLVHVLTAYKTDLLGEAEVQAFLLGSKWRSIHIVLLLGLLRMLARQKTTPKQIWPRLWRAYRRGCNSQFDVDAWQPELHWEMPLDRVKAQFHL